MTVASKSWQDIIAVADAYKTVGHTEVYLDRASLDDYPWEFVVKCEPGGSHRLDIDTSVWFYADHPSGLSFRWSFDIEPASANGSGRYQIDVPAVRRVLAKLDGVARAAFRAYLHRCATAVRKTAEEYSQYAQDQYGMAETLARLGDYEPAAEVNP